jgi:hypothetical protein
VDPCEMYIGTQRASGHPHQIVEMLFTLN